MKSCVGDTRESGHGRSRGACRLRTRPRRRSVRSAHSSGGGVIANLELTQRAFTTILQHFVSTGRAPHYSELADRLGIELEQARVLQRDAADAAPIAGYWLSTDTDFIESWAPFSNVPTHHLITIEGVPKWYGQ